MCWLSPAPCLDVELSPESFFCNSDTNNAYFFRVIETSDDLIASTVQISTSRLWRVGGLLFILSEAVPPPQWMCRNDKAAPKVRHVGNECLSLSLSHCRLSARCHLAFQSNLLCSVSHEHRSRWIIVNSGLRLEKVSCPSQLRAIYLYGTKPLSWFFVSLGHDWK